MAPVRTTGSAEFKGVCGGVRGTPGKAYRDGLEWSVFGNIGYGEAEITGFGGGFRQSEDGLFVEIGTGVLFKLSDRVSVGPQMSYVHFDEGGLEMKGVNAEIVLEFALR